ncbi:MAG TPA: TonB-dependent receptor, partial [Prolixibacteraceae bacterium]|nr:TonB-dependent receptor [Prolixibacteraceae bacterium]
MINHLILLLRKNVEKWGILFVLLVFSLPGKSFQRETGDSIHYLPEVSVSSGWMEGKLKKNSGSISLAWVENNAPSLGSLLNALPGIWIQDGAVNTQRITLRGMGSRTPYASNRIMAYLNDIPITYAGGFTSLDQLDVASLDRIEVIKGPSSALYGSGLGGAIRAITSRSGETLKTGFRSASFNTGWFTSGMARSTPEQHVQWSWNERWSNGYRQNSRFSKTNLLFEGERKIGNASLGLLLLYHRLDAQIASSLDEQTFTNHPSAAASNWLAVQGYERSSRILAGASVKNTFSPSFSNKLIVFGSISDEWERRPFNNLGTELQMAGLRDLLFYHRKQIDITLGGEWLLEKNDVLLTEPVTIPSGTWINRNSEQRSVVNLFGSLRYSPFPFLQLTAGLNANKLHSVLSDLFPDNGDQSGINLHSPIVSPRVGLSVELSQQLVLFGSFGHGFSHADFEEGLLPDGSYNLSLRPEQGWMGEAGVRFFSRKKTYYSELGVYAISLNNLLLTRR